MLVSSHSLDMLYRFFYKQKIYFAPAPANILKYGTSNSEFVKLSPVHQEFLFYKHFVSVFVLLIDFLSCKGEGKGKG